MNRYKIYCTEEQTKKALELGAPIETKGIYPPIINIDNIIYFVPTAEQMLGFIRSKNIHIVIHKDVVDKWSVYGHEIEPIEFTVFNRLGGFDSFKEATLAAIDAALDYLSKFK